MGAVHIPIKKLSVSSSRSMFCHKPEMSLMRTLHIDIKIVLFLDLGLLFCIET